MKPTIEQDQKRQALAITLPGDLNGSAVQEWRAEIDSALEVPPGKVPWQEIKLDLTAAKTVDSMGLNLIVRIHKSAQQHGSRVRLIYNDLNVHRTLTFTRLDRHVELVKQ